MPRVCEHTGLSADDVIRLHTATEFTVYAIGFVPGFPYMGYLPAELCGVRRLPSPRVRVEPGSVGITGRQTAIYPQASPGGWNLIGRTPLVDRGRGERVLPAARSATACAFARIDERRVSGDWRGNGWPSGKRRRADGEPTRSASPRSQRELDTSPRLPNRLTASRSASISAMNDQRHAEGAGPRRVSAKMPAGTSAELRRGVSVPSAISLLRELVQILVPREDVVQRVDEGVRPARASRSGSPDRGSRRRSSSPGRRCTGAA